MTIVSLKTEQSGVVKVEFSDNSSLLLATDYLPSEVYSGGIFFGEKNSDGAMEARELTSGEEDVFRFSASCYKAEKTALRLTARAEQNSQGLTVKLKQRGFDTAVARAVVSHFLERNLLDDRRFAELWIRPYLSGRKACSPRWLLASLQKRGIDRRTAETALRKALDPETEYALLLKYLERTVLHRSENARFIRAQLKNEGFSPIVLDMFFNES